MNGLIDPAVLTAGNLIASIVSGLVAGLYLVAIHPPVELDPRRRAILFGWFLGFPLSILYAVRIVISAYRSATEPDFASDLPRLTAAWVLAILFAVVVALGAAFGFRIRRRLAKRRLRRARDVASGTEEGPG